MRRRRRKTERELALAYLGVKNAADMELKHVIKSHVDRVLDASDENVSLAADILGMHRRSLQRMLRRRLRRYRRTKGRRRS